MGRISKALDKLRTKCTSEGATPHGNGIADILDCMAEHYEAGSSLPEVTAEDDGKVLKVVEGEWTKGEASVGGGMVVTVTVDSEDMSATADKTIAEIISAFRTGVCPVANLTLDGEIGMTLPIARAEVTTVDFGLFKAGEGGVLNYALNGNSTDGTDTWTFNASY